MYRILMNVSGNSACSYYRAVLPWAMCCNDLKKEGIILDQSENLDYKNLEYDCYIFHRLASDRLWPTLWDIKHNLKKKIVWDLDDNLFHIPEWSSVREMMQPHHNKVLGACLEWADYISVTTDRFKSQLAEFPTWGDKIHVNPNLLDLNDWNIPQNAIEGGPTRILWAGSTTHSGDLEIVVPAIIELIKKYRDDVKFIFWGMIPDGLRPSRIRSREANELLHRSVVFVNACELQFYPQAMNMVCPEFAIIPIEDNKFNNAKSNIKYLEMTMAGATCIASDCGPYKDTITDGENGFLVENDARKWFEKLDSLIENRYYYNVIQNQYNADYLVRSEYSWTGKRKETWMNFFRMLAGREVATSST